MAVATTTAATATSSSRRHRHQVKRFRRSGGDQGSAAVEFALVLPVLMLILFGIIDFGRMLHARIVLSQAAHEGARTAAILDEAAADNTIDAVLGSMVDGLEGRDVTDCEGAVGGDATVTLTYGFAFATPLNLLFDVGDGDGATLTAEAVVPCL
jgi:Flp pilus assembly protein TadG